MVFCTINTNMNGSENKTICTGQLPEQVTEELLYELFLQAGPLEKVKIIRERDRRQKTYAYITYIHDVSVPYAINLFRGTKLFNYTLTLYCRGRIALLPPAIRCYGPDPSIVFPNETMVAQQFANMTENLHRREKILDEPKKRDDQLMMASLQGNWTHRHHPYRSKEHSHNRDNYRYQEHDNHRQDKPSSNWRNRRYNHRGYQHRRN